MAFEGAFRLVVACVRVCACDELCGVPKVNCVQFIIVLRCFYCRVFCVAVWVFWMHCNCYILTSALKYLFVWVSNLQEAFFSMVHQVTNRSVRHSQTITHESCKLSVGLNQPSANINAYARACSHAMFCVRRARTLSMHRVAVAFLF